MVFPLLQLIMIIFQRLILFHSAAKLCAYQEWGLYNLVGSFVLCNVMALGLV